MTTMVTRTLPYIVYIVLKSSAYTSVRNIHLVEGTENIINQLFTSAQHLLLLILGLHVSTDHSVIFMSLISYKFHGAVHTFGIPIVFTLKLNPFISVGG